MTTAYADFLALKEQRARPVGRSVAAEEIHPRLYGFQREICRWAIRVGRAAIWADVGLGKTGMQLEWGRLSGETTLIVAPLAVCQQTVREAALLGIDARYTRDGGYLDPGMWVTNYEQVSKFDPAGIDAVVLDESSILKNSTGVTRNLLIHHFREVPHRLACSATPAPNDPEELTSQAEFLGVMSRVDMLAAYFIHDDAGWRLKKHARIPMFRWMSTWATALRMPSDIGYPDDGYVLPGLEIMPELLAVEVEAEGQLFATDLGGVGGRARIRKETTAIRVARAMELIREDKG